MFLVMGAAGLVRGDTRSASSSRTFGVPGGCRKVPRCRGTVATVTTSAIRHTHFPGSTVTATVRGVEPGIAAHPAVLRHCRDVSRPRPEASPALMSATSWIATPSTDTWVALGALFILLGLGFLLAIAGFWLWALVDAASRPRELWQAAGHDKDLWLWGVIVGGGLAGWMLFGIGGFIGPLVYVLGPRRELKRLSDASSRPTGPAPEPASGTDPHRTSDPGDRTL